MCLRYAVCATDCWNVLIVRILLCLLLYCMQSAPGYRYNSGHALLIAKTSAYC